MIANQPPHPSSPTGGEGPRRARSHNPALNRTIAPLPPLWGRVGVGGQPNTNHQPPHPSSPTGGEGPRRTRNHHSAPNSTIASLPPLWGRVGVGGQPYASQTQKAPK